MPNGYGGRNPPRDFAQGQSPLEKELLQTAGIIGNNICVKRCKHSSLALAQHKYRNQRRSICCCQGLKIKRSTYKEVQCLVIDNLLVETSHKPWLLFCIHKKGAPGCCTGPRTPALRCTPALVTAPLSAHPSQSVIPIKSILETVAYLCRLIWMQNQYRYNLFYKFPHLLVGVLALAVQQGVEQLDRRLLHEVVAVLAHQVRLAAGREHHACK